MSYPQQDELNADYWRLEFDIADDAAGRLQLLLDRLKEETEHSREWQAGFDAARYQAACDIGHFLVDEGVDDAVAEKAYDRLAMMVWNPRVRSDDG